MGWLSLPCATRRRGDQPVQIRQAARPLFPGNRRLFARTEGEGFLLDGELIIPLGDALSFDALQLRLHPAESRMRKLARKRPRAYAVRPARNRRAVVVDRPLGGAPCRARAFFATNAVPAFCSRPLHLRPLRRPRLAEAQRRRARRRHRQAAATTLTIRASGR